MTDFAPAASLRLGRLDVLARKDAVTIWRAASYSSGDEWQRDWTATHVTPQSADGPGYAMSGEGRIAHLCVRSAEGLGRHVSLRRTSNFGRTWSEWAQIGAGTFTSPPAVATSSDGLRVFVVARGDDKRIWFARSFDAGTTWDVAWKAIGDGTFRADAPALVATPDLERIHVFGRGTNDGVWRATTTNFAGGWTTAWKEVEGLRSADSAPAAAASADGKRVYLFVRHVDGRIHRTTSDDAGKTWSQWSPVPAGTGFRSAPSSTCSWNGQDIHVVAMGADRRIWRARSIDGGKHWPVAWTQIQKEVF